MKKFSYNNVYSWFIVFPLLTFALPIPTSASLLDGLVAYYAFDGNANDLSGNGNNGIVNGAALTADRFGNVNSAYSFDGVNDFISASADMLPTAERTVAFWFEADAVINQPVFMGYGGGSCGTSWFMGLNAGPAVYNDSYYVSSHCGVNTLVSEYQEDPIGVWQHLAISTDIEGTTIYVDGVEVASNNNYITNTNVAGRDLAIGVATSPGGVAPYTDSNVGYFDGVLDDVRIYDRALSASEVDQLASVPITPAVWLFGSGLLGLVGIARRKKA